MSSSQNCTKIQYFSIPNKQDFAIFQHFYTNNKLICSIAILMGVRHCLVYEKFTVYLHFNIFMARNSFFEFKQFRINQENCAMKVGTDGVLLGAWTSIPLSTTRILDIGTGSGLLALMLAQRTCPY